MARMRTAVRRILMFLYTKRVLERCFFKRWGGRWGYRARSLLQFFWSLPSATVVGPAGMQSKSEEDLAGYVRDAGGPARALMTRAAPVAVLWSRVHFVRTARNG